MIDWSQPMRRSYEYWIVNPYTWKDERRLTNVTGCSITRDLSAETIASGSIDTDEKLGECYVRAYLSVLQNGSKMKVPLATLLCQTPSKEYSRNRIKYSVTMYSPLLELKDHNPELGLTVEKGSNIMTMAHNLCSVQMRAPLEKVSDGSTLYSDYISNLNDTWLTFLIDLVSQADRQLMLDALGKVTFIKGESLNAMEPVWIYNDDNSSILHPDYKDKSDYYGVPNVVEVVYSNSDGYFFSRIENRDADSPISIQNRGREVMHRVTDPTFNGVPTQTMVDEYAKAVLLSDSTLKHTVTYTHAYCPVYINDCVILNHIKFGHSGVKALVTNQSIKCESDCSVTETAVYTETLWSGRG